MNIKVMEPKVYYVPESGITIGHNLGHKPTIVNVHLLRDGDAWPVDYWFEREPDAKNIYLKLPVAGKVLVSAVYFGGV